MEDLEDFEVASVYKDGRLVVDKGTLINFPQNMTGSSPAGPSPLNIAPLTSDDLRIPKEGKTARVIELVPGQIITRMRNERITSTGKWVMSDTESDILKLCVVERHKASGCIGLGLVCGFGLKQGAIASSVAHDSHNVIAVGVNDEETYRAIEEVRMMGGGLAVVSRNKTLAKTPLEVAGLMSKEPLETLVDQLNHIKQAARDLGCKIAEPFMTLSFLALPVVPELKLTDKGLVDVNRFEIVPLFLENN